MKLSPPQRGQAKLGILFGRQIHDDQAIDAGGLGVAQESSTP